MQGNRAVRVLALVIVSPILLTTVGTAAANEPGYTRSFRLEECGEFSSSGRNPFFLLEPGYQLRFRGEEDGDITRLTITVLHKTIKINGVEVRIVREVETVNGDLVEISLNYFALCQRDNSVVYFGEDVDIYEDGVIVSHAGSWRAGVNGARAGIIMPGTVLLGARYYQEIAPGVALDRAEIISIDDVVDTPAGRFRKCVKTQETTPLEPGAEGFKWYAPGVGLIRDGVLKLVNRS